MFSANIYVIVDLNYEGRKKLEECKKTLIELEDAISKCKGSCPDTEYAISLIERILDGEPID